LESQGPLHGRSAHEKKSCDRGGCQRRRTVLLVASVRKPKPREGRKSERERERVRGDTCKRNAGPHLLTGGRGWGERACIAVLSREKSSEKKHTAGRGSTGGSTGERLRESPVEPTKGVVKSKYLPRSEITRGDDTDSKCNSRRKNHGEPGFLPNGNGWKNG